MTNLGWVGAIFWARAGFWDMGPLKKVGVILGSPNQILKLHLRQWFLSDPTQP